MKFLRELLNTYAGSVVSKKKQRRQARYTFNPAAVTPEQLELPEVAAIDAGLAALQVVELFPVVIVARQYNTLPPSLQRFFVRGVK
jgi:hypothetical protein